MYSSPAPPLVRSSTPHLWLGIALVVMILMPVSLVVGVTSYFRLSSDTRALRNGVIKSSGAEWRQRIALNVGGLTLGAVRAGLSFVPLDTRARAALDTLRGAEFGLYQLSSGAEPPACAALLAAADTAMRARGWDRVVGVIDGDDLVTVYVPEKATSARRLECCVLVFDGRQMILASAQANLQPLFQLALEETAARHQTRLVSKR